MEFIDRRVIREGVIAGVLGAVLVAIWFLLFDAVQGQPLRTPALLGAAVFQGLRDPQALEITVGIVLGYSVLHGLAFLVFGILCAFLIVAAEREPSLLLAFIALFACFSVFFLGLLWVLAEWLLGAISWWAVLVANLLAAAAMLGYFFLGHRPLGRELLGSLAGVIREGVVGGLIGAGIVAVWFLIFDAFRGRPFYTPALLGAAVFEGLRDPALVETNLGVILGYTVLHGAAFVAFGLLCAILIVAAEREPSLLWAFVALFACFEVFFLVLDLVFAESALGAIAWWVILAGNVLATAGMFAYFFLGHRALGRSLLGEWAQVIREGFLAGMVGAAIVAIWFLIYDAANGQPLQTPALLGAAVFQGLTDPTTLDINLGAILGYTFLHGLAFTLFGIVTAFLVAAAERQPVLLLGLFMLFAAFEVFFFGLVMVLGQSLLGSLVWWAIFVANLLAAAGMLLYFFLGHRALGRRLLETWPPREE
ncbi:MAG: hypothetical protein ACE5NC_06320 [Anaerolineae bacterium]